MSPTPTPPAAPSPPQLPRGYQRPLPRRSGSPKDWLIGIVMMSFFFWGAYQMIALARRVPMLGYFFAAMAVLGFAFDVLMLARGHSMIIVWGAIFAAATVLTFVPDLALGALLALLTAAAYVGGLLLIAFRKRA